MSLPNKAGILTLIAGFEEDEAKGPKFLVFFDIEKTLNLIGGGTPDITMT